jgi:hypothetical protein
VSRGGCGETLPPWQTLNPPTSVAVTMLGRLLAWLGTHLRREDEAADESSEESRFVPSALDASVRYAHGGSVHAGEQEIAELEAEGRNLEAERRER